MWTRGKHTSVDLTKEDEVLLKAVSARIGRSQSATVGIAVRLFDRLVPNEKMWLVLQKTSFKETVDHEEVSK